jgi:hypothetical protein
MECSLSLVNIPRASKHATAFSLLSFFFCTTFFLDVRMAGGILFRLAVPSVSIYAAVLLLVSAFALVAAQLSHC